MQQGYSPGTNSASPVLVDHIAISGLIFDGDINGTPTPSTAPLITFWRASNISFTDDTFRNAPGIGVLLSNVDHTGFTDCTFNNIGNTANPSAAANSDPFYQGVAFCCSDTNDSVANYVANCTFSAIGLDAISATDQTGFSATANSMSGLATLPASYWETRTEGAAGIYLSNDDTATITGNSVQGASGDALDITDSDDLSIVGNTFSRSGGSGIALSDVDGISIVGNAITDNNQVTDHFFCQAGITVADRLWGNGGLNSTDITVADNLITDDQPAKTQNWAIQVSMQANPQDLEITTDNTLSGNVAPAGLGANGIAQAWIDGANGPAEDLANTAGATQWTPVFVTSPPLSMALATDTSACTLKGTGDPYFPVVLTNGTTNLGTATPDSAGNWSFAPTGLAGGPITIVATQTNMAGQAESATLNFVLDPQPSADTMALPPEVLSDILFRDPASGTLGDYQMTGGQPTWATVGWADPGLQVIGTGDFNGNGTSDILFRDPTGGGSASSP